MKHALLMALLIAAVCALALWRVALRPGEGPGADQRVRPASEGRGGARGRPESPGSPEGAPAPGASQVDACVETLQRTWLTTRNPKDLIPGLVALELLVEQSDQRRHLDAVWRRTKDETLALEVRCVLTLLAGAFKNGEIEAELWQTLTSALDEKLLATAEVALLLSRPPPRATRAYRTKFWDEMLLAPGWSSIVFPGYRSSEFRSRLSQGLRHQKSFECVPRRLEGADRLDFISAVLGAAPKITDPDLRQQFVDWIELPEKNRERVVALIETALLGESDAVMRDLYYHYLSRVGSAEARAVLLSAYRTETNEQLQALLIRHLGWHNLAELSGGDICSLYETSCGSVRLALVAEALRDGGARARDFVRLVAWAEPDETVRVQIASCVASGRLPARDAAEMLKTFLEDPSASVRIESLRGLGRVAPQESLAIFQHHASLDGDRRVQEAARELYLRHAPR